jgi:hypothetical protein
VIYFPEVKWPWPEAQLTVMRRILNFLLKILSKFPFDLKYVFWEKVLLKLARTLRTVNMAYETYVIKLQLSAGKL